MKMAITVRETDVRFPDSPEEGTQTCMCSRCQKKIGESEFALRMWPQDGRYELRYCKSCQAEMGIVSYDDETEL